MAGNEEVVELCKEFVKDREAISSRRRVESWALPACFVPEQAFPLYIMQVVGNIYKNAALHEKCLHISLSRWSEQLEGRFYSMDVKSRSRPDHEEVDNPACRF